MVIIVWHYKQACVFNTTKVVAIDGPRRVNLMMYVAVMCYDKSKFTIS